jgi:hypothetical protein
MMNDQAPAVHPARAKLREILADLGSQGHAYTGPGIRARLHEAGFEVRRETVQRWLAEDRHYWESADH